jgi:hypothetical protein
LRIRRRLDPGRIEGQGIKPCIPGRTSRGKALRHDKRPDKTRTRIEIVGARLKGRRRIVTRDDRCPEVFLSAAAPSQPSCSSLDNQ